MMPSAFTHARPKARIRHKCCECLGVIRIGEHYHRISGIWDGTPATFKVCNQCEEIRDMDDLKTPVDERIPLGELEENLPRKGEMRELFYANKAARKPSGDETI